MAVLKQHALERCKALCSALGMAYVLIDELQVQKVKDHQEGMCRAQASEEMLG